MVALFKLWKKYNEIKLTKKWTWTIEKSKIIHLPPCSHWHEHYSCHCRMQIQSCRQQNLQNAPDIRIYTYHWYTKKKVLGQTQSTKKHIMQLGVQCLTLKNYIINIIIIKIIKKGRYSKAGKEWSTPSQCKAPATQYQHIDRKMRNGKIIEDKKG